MKKKTIGIIVVAVLSAFAVFAGVMFIHQYTDTQNSTQKFDDLSALIVDFDTDTTLNTEENDSPQEAGGDCSL